MDALLGEQPREHADIDVVNRLEPGTMDIGFARSPWIHVGGGRSSNVFCTVTYGGREIDFHSERFDESGNGIYRVENGSDYIFPAEAFRGTGLVDGVQVP